MHQSFQPFEDFSYDHRDMFMRLKLRSISDKKPIEENKGKSIYQMEVVEMDPKSTEGKFAQINGAISILK